MALIAISGGIGSGKSVVAKILSVKGYPVYDCDSRAKQIMDCDEAIHSSLCEYLHPRAVVESVIDRKLISEIVFKDAEKLKTLNAIVHKAVFRDMRNWRKANEPTSKSIVFVESAILRSSGLIDMVDEEWRVYAPLDVRIERVMSRSAISREQILERIKSQKIDEDTKPSSGVPLSFIDNSPDVAILPQIYSLLK